MNDEEFVQCKDEYQDTTDLDYDLVLYAKEAWCSDWGLKLITALEAAKQRIATMTESYNSIGKINADQALEIRELKLKLNIKETKK